jgi:hypothetical protein
LCVTSQNAEVTVTDQSPTLDSDDQPIWGARSIGVEIKKSEKATHHLLEKKVIPADKVGGVWVTTPRRLRAFFAGEAKR